MSQMTEIQRVVDDIRAFLRSFDRDRDPLPAVGSDQHRELTQLADDYARFCSEANRRLKHCQRLLNQGDVAEALRAADADPRLLSVAHVLVFDELPDWLWVVQGLSLRSPEAILVESVSAIDQAFADAKPLEGLLRTHRRLALGRAPLTDRIAHLQRLVVADGLNPIWEEDLGIYQQARIRQIDEEAADADRRGDFEALERLADELARTDWRAPVSSEKEAGVRRRAKRLRREAAYRNLPELADRLVDAMALNDESGGLNARLAWNEAITLARPQENDPIVARVQAALDWLDGRDRVIIEEDNRRRALVALEQALKAGKASAKTLRAQGKEARAFGTLPDELRRRLDKRLLELEARDRWVRRIAVGLAATTTLAVAVMLVLQKKEADRNRRVEDESAALMEQYNASDFDRALTRADELKQSDPAVAEDPRIVELRGQIAEARQAEIDRKAGFEAAMQKAGEDLGDGPDADLDHAESLASTEDEKGLVEKLKGEHAAARKGAIKKADDALVPRIEDLNKEIQSLAVRVDGPGDAGPILEDAGALEREHQKLTGLLHEESEHRQTLDTWKGRLADLRQAAERRVALGKAEQRITEAIASARPVADPINAAAYVAAVKDLVEKNSPSDRAEGLREGLKEEASWRDALAWADCLRRWRAARVDLDRDADAIVAAAASYLEQHGGGASAEVAAQLRRAGEAVKSRPKLDEELGQFFKSPYMNYYEIKLSPDKRYYCSKRPSISTNSLSTEIVEVCTADDVRKVPIRVAEIVRQGPSPQARLAAVAQKLMETRTGTPWAEQMLELLRQVREDAEVDRYFQAVILQYIGQRAARGSLPLGEALQEDLKRLDQLDDGVDWIDPEKKNTSINRERASKLTGRLDLMAVRKKAQASRDRLQEILRRDLAPVGWLSKERGTWSCRLGVVPEGLRDADLWAVAPSRVGAKAAWKKIGALKNGAVDRLDVDARAVEGRPVFAGGPPDFGGESR